MRLTAVGLAALVLAVSPTLLADQADQADQTEPGPGEVFVKVVCRPNDEGPKSVTVNPWLLLLQKGGTATWKLKITRPKKNWIVVEPKDRGRWPFVEKKHEGEEEARAQGMVPQPEGEYLYNIKVYCNDDGTVIDPRVRVGP